MRISRQGVDETHRGCPRRKLGVSRRTGVRGRRNLGRGAVGIITLIEPWACGEQPVPGASRHQPRQQDVAHRPPRLRPRPANAGAGRPEGRAGRVSPAFVIPRFRRCSAGGWCQGVGEGCTVCTEGLEAATGGTSAMMTAATVRRSCCWSASGLAPFALLRRTYREWPSG